MKAKSDSTLLNSFYGFSALNFLRPALSFLLLPLYLHYLSPSEYGKLALLGIVAAMFGVFTNLKLDQAMRTYYFDYQTDPHKLSRYLSTVLSVSMMVSGVLIFLMYFVGQSIFDLLFNTEELHFYPLGLIAIIAVASDQCSSCYFVYLQNERKLSEFVFLRLLGIAVSLLAQLCLVIIFEFGILGILVGSLISSSIVFIMVCLRNRRAFTCSPDLTLLLPSVKFSLPLIIFALFFTFERQVDRLVIERFMDLETVGVYALLLTLLGAGSLVFNAVDNSIRPYLYNSLKLTSELGDVRYYLSLYLLIGLFTFSVIIAIASNLTAFTANTRYLVIDEYIVPAVFAFIPMCFTRFYALIYMFYKKSVSLTFWTFIKTLITLGLLVVLVPRYGIHGALWAVFVGHLVNVLIFALHLRKFSKPIVEAGTLLSMITLFAVFIWLIPTLFQIKFSGEFSVLPLIIFPALAYLLYKKKIHTFLQLKTHNN